MLFPFNPFKIFEWMKARIAVRQRPNSSSIFNGRDLRNLIRMSVVWNCEIIWQCEKYSEIFITRIEWVNWRKLKCLCSCREQIRKIQAKRWLKRSTDEIKLHKMSTTVRSFNRIHDTFMRIFWRFVIFLCVWFFDLFLCFMCREQNLCEQTCKNK